MMITKAQIATIHALKNRIGLDDEAYRAMLSSMTGKHSSKLLTQDEAGHVIEAMQREAGAAWTRGAVAGLDAPVARKLRALWIAGWNLGVVRDRSDRAMLAFLERQTRVSHTRFLRHPGDASKAVEGLKTWLSRAAGVVWPPQEDAADSRVAVIDAQWRRLAELGAVTWEAYPRPFLAAYAQTVLGRPCGLIETLSARELDAVSTALGRKLRAALADQREEARAS
jgi:phage gp16-like protein